MIKKSYAKVNIFLKIAGKQDNYHLIVSRFVRVKNLFDIVRFEKGNFNTFTLDGDFGCDIKQNTIYKAYMMLCDISLDVKEFFKNHKVIVEKNIPEFAGLGGGSSNCATFMLMVNRYCNLNLTKDNLAKMSASIGADVPFFVYEYDSANVTGIGQIVQKFDEDSLDIEVWTPYDIKCDTKAIFTSFRDRFYKQINNQEANRLLSMKSLDILKELDIYEANDLFLPALFCNDKLKTIYQELGDQYYFSGSGSNFFRIIDGKKR